MAEFRAGLTDAMDSAARRAYEYQGIESMRSQDEARRKRMEQEAEDRKKLLADEAFDQKVGLQSIKALAKMQQQLGAPPGGPQPPMPGQASQPMQPPPAGGMPPPPPMAQMMGPQGGGQVPPAAPPQGWQPSPSASPSLGGPPPGAPPPGGQPGAAPGGGLPPPPGMPGMGGQPPAGGVPQQMGELPPQWLSVPKAIEAMEKVGVPPEQQYQTLSKMMPMIDKQNKEALAELGLSLKVAHAMEEAKRTAIAEYKATQGPAAVRTAEFAESGAPGADLLKDKLTREGTLSKSQRPGGGGGAGGAPGIGLSADAIDDAADQYNATGQIPAMYRDVKGREKVMNRAAERKRAGLTSDIAGDRASFKADASSLTQRQRFVDTGNQFIKNMQSQADLVDQYMAKGAAGGVPALNKWIQSGRKAIAGDPDVTALDTAIRGLAREHQRIVTGVTSNAQLHVAAQETADQLLNVAQTPAQMRAAIKVMREEATNAVKAGKDEVAEIRARMKGGKTESGTPPTNAKGWALHTDKNGNKAYVSPDGKQFEEVKQ